MLVILSGVHFSRPFQTNNRAVWGLTCLRGTLGVGVGLSADFSSCRRAPTPRRPSDFCETPNCCSHTSLTRSWRQTCRSPRDTHGWLETQDWDSTWGSASIAASSSATQRCSLWTWRGWKRIFSRWFQTLDWSHTVHCAIIPNRLQCHWPTDSPVSSGPPGLRPSPEQQPGL